MTRSGAATRAQAPSRESSKRASGMTVGVLILAAAALQALPFLRASFLPFVDMPQHLAMARILEQRHDERLHELFEITLFPQVNILGLLSTTPLVGRLGEVNTVRAFVLLYLVGLAWASFRLARAVGGTKWNVLLALLLALNVNVWSGFLSFFLGLPFLILLLARIATPCRSHLGAATLDGVVWFLLALAHVLLFAFALLAAGLWFLFAPVARRQRALRLLPLLLPLLYVLAWAAHARLLSSDAAGFTVAWDDARTKWLDAGWSLITASADATLEWSVMALLAGLVAFLLAREWRLARVRHVAGEERWPARMRAWIRTCALLALLLYIVLPYSVADRELTTQGLFLLHHRFLVLGPLLLIPTLLWPSARGARAALIGVALLLHLTLALHWNELVARVGAQARGLDGAIEVIPPHVKVKSLIYMPYPVGLRFSAFLHVASLYQARKLGEVDQSFALLPTTPVHYRNPRRPYLSQRDENLAPAHFDWRRASLYDYLLLYDPRGTHRRLYARTPHRLVYSHNGWMLLKVQR
ncbi:MAG: hypothetical protein JSW67_07295 [Candidatus Latescibacterota bacterium]|nr:MAG: hypothetical protein JSW67_07295 [Candidatus Latescibacterota bacterium]